jgi:hypothetical protein
LVFACRRHLALIAALVVAFFPTPSAIADTSIATLTVTGVVPTYFSVSARSGSEDLDLTPKVAVTNRVIGGIHFKFNENVQSMTISSSTVSGGPEDAGGNPYGFGAGGPFKVGFEAGCASVNPTYNTPVLLTQAGVDVKSVLASALINQGIEEDCNVIASYKGTTTNLPLAGRFSVGIVITMVAP